MNSWERPFCTLVKLPVTRLRHTSVQQRRTLTSLQIAKFMGPTWGPPGSCRPQMGPMLVPWTLLSRSFYKSKQTVSYATDWLVKLHTLPSIKTLLIEIWFHQFPLWNAGSLFTKMPSYRRICCQDAWPVKFQNDRTTVNLHLRASRFREM